MRKFTHKNTYTRYKLHMKIIKLSTNVSIFLRVLMKLILEFMNGIIENELCKTKL